MLQFNAQLRSLMTSPGSGDLQRSKYWSLWFSTHARRRNRRPHNMAPERVVGCKTRRERESGGGRNSTIMIVFSWCRIPFRTQGYTVKLLAIKPRDSEFVRHAESLQEVQPRSQWMRKERDGVHWIAGGVGWKRRQPLFYSSIFLCIILLFWPLSHDLYERWVFFIRNYFARCLR